MPDEIYNQRLRRYVTAMSNEKPDTVPIRPFAAEFTASYAGYTCQQVTHDYKIAFEAVRRCACDFDWDAVVANMVYVWTGLTEALGLRYYAVPGVDIGPDVGFQYREPSEADAFMKANEYDALIDDPTAFLYSVWLPRVARDVPDTTSPASYRGQVALVKAAMAMSSYFSAFGPQVEQLRTQCQMPSAIAGILKAPFDILADKLRGYMGLTMDMQQQPGTVLRACEALMPHLLDVACRSADQTGTLPVGFWMHRGCVPFVSPGQFESHYWPTVSPIIEELWSRGIRTLFYAEGDWGWHLDRFAELPDASIVFHCDRTDLSSAHKKLGAKFCLSGGVPNVVLSHGNPDEVRECVRKAIEIAGREGGYIVDASAILQNDTETENIRAMTQAAREFGQYQGQAYSTSNAASSAEIRSRRKVESDSKPPGVCVTWNEKLKEMPGISGDEELVRRVWEDIDAMGAGFIWQMLVSF